MAGNKGTALITGASSGIGATYADRLAKRGLDLVLVARNEKRLKALANRLRSETGVSVSIFPADLTDDTDVLHVEIRLAASDITVLVNSAGMSLNGSLLQNGTFEISQIINLNVCAVARLAAAAAKAFSVRGGGSIINVSSAMALAPEIYDGIYSGTKAFVLNLSQAMSAHFSEMGIYTQAVLPGVIKSELWKTAGQDLNHFPPEIVMTVDDVVDSALKGFDRRETVTIPFLECAEHWEIFEKTRTSLSKYIYCNQPASRYL
ncbi:SDR family NAD(P)-dependent oxidoreductase [Pseudomonas sp. NY15435]|uniref:SDR family NAD(P)-dependent oxidoreductase n=1 Tax=Pseudomonas sp. NY15435 TaxID=3400358 RepID=UPI003A86B626